MIRVFVFLLSYSAIMLPSYLFLFLSVDYSATYTQGAGYFTALLFQIAVIAVFCFMCAIRIKKREHGSVTAPVRTKINAKIYALVKLEKYAIFLYFIISVYIFLSGSNDYRHASTFGANAIIATSAEIMRTLILATIVVKVCNPKVTGLVYSNNYLLFLFILSSMIGSTGSYMIVQSLFVSTLTYLYINKVTITKAMILGLGGTVTISIAIFIGFANKFQFDMDKMYIMFIVDRSYVINYLAWRVATFLHSITFWLSFSQQFDILAIVYEESVYRVSKILGGPAVHPDIRSMARVNYLNIFIDNSHYRSGTTPGLFGGIASLLQNQKIALLLIIAITASMIRLLACYPARSLGILPVMIISAASYHFFDNVIDYLIVPSPSFLYFLVFLSVIYIVRIRLI